MDKYKCSVCRVVYFVLRATDPFIPHDAPRPSHVSPHTRSTPSSSPPTPVTRSLSKVAHQDRRLAMVQLCRHHRTAPLQRSSVLATSPQTPGAQYPEGDVRPKETPSLRDPTAHHLHPPSKEMLSRRA
ncbi:hypothetical protein E2C01_029107 [Portunus trituberculatus]|uniref:Uncharacterized protein n=1 Tax=Portunus trituberculatus TaxID=210409 RepID=A0A5B7EQX6_PORTR|nr:hypothetical protein [Portunus trituberculatus]